MTEGVNAALRQAASASFLSHVETPKGRAFLRYSLRACGVQRTSTRAVEGFLMGGLPLGRLGLSIHLIVRTQIVLDKGPEPLYSVRTVNTEEQMETIKIEGIEYKVVKTKEFEHNGDKRKGLTLQRPNGKKFYFAVVYGNGAISSVVGGL